MNNTYENFKLQVRSILGLDLNSYKEQQMRRRINQWLDRHGLDTYNDLITTIKQNNEHRNKFFEYLTINTSHFFRDKAVFEVIAEQIIPDITTANKRPLIWSAGCSIGAEIYSIAILLQEQGVQARKLWATDLDEVIISKARRGIYSANEIAHIPSKLLATYFTEVNGKYELDETLRKLVTFELHNLLKDTATGPFDLILCRNVFIYFTNETQNRLLQMFSSVLRPGGYFVVGSAEHIMNPEVYSFRRVSYCIYQKC